MATALSQADFGGVCANDVLTIRSACRSGFHPRSPG
jgi:hypothetical protein